MSIEERYAKAIRTSHLEVEEAPGDADMVIAAGMSESLGVLLARLKAEWDAAAGEVAQVARTSKRLAEARADAIAAAKEPNAKPFDVAAFDRDAERELLTARALILMNLRSLAPAKQAIFEFARGQSQHKGVLPQTVTQLRAEVSELTAKLGTKLDATDRAVVILSHRQACVDLSDAIAVHDRQIGALVGRVLDVWLDKLCHHCEGRGFNGGYGVARTTCTKCRGTGSRRQGLLSETSSLHHFGLWLLNVLDTKCNGSMAQMSRKVRTQ